MEFTTPSLLWFIAGILLLLLEMTVPGFVLVFFAAGAWITAAMAWFLPLGPYGQFVVFTCSSVLSLLLLRRSFTKRLVGDTGEGDGDGKVVEPGTRGVVVADIIPPREGRVTVGTTVWRAAARQKIYAGEIVEVLDQDMFVVEVRRVEELDLLR